ncbi:MAG: hypothetical protein UT12_C0019G0010 [Candidatus Curtissbacteria bacterium GW2011_GWC2_38_9]|nr:MAG: hypothetical protein UT12_C0019G0010 [Candidatus Curtissbacteria bacterium GW2011_GWC2_38_9]KKS03261.1 MAG: hypothetical protein UU56_C0021G0009 [Candidatus Curtissbacteria bacterium GW2011_GWA2_41_24]
MQPSPQNNFLTKDLYLGAILYSKQMKLEGVKRDGRVCWFEFLDKDACENLQKEFFSKSLEVNAKEYADAIKTLKDLVFSEM